MIETTYDPTADAVYVRMGRGKVASTTQVAENVILDRDDAGRLLGIEILTATKVLAPGRWTEAPAPESRSADAAE